MGLLQKASIQPPPNPSVALGSWALIDLLTWGGKGGGNGTGSLPPGWVGGNDREARARIPGRATVRSARLRHPYCRDGEHRVGAATQQAHCAPTFVTCNPIAGLISTALVLPQGRRIARGYHGGSFERLPSQARGPRYLQSFSVLEGPSLGHLTDGQIPATVAVRALEGNEAALAWGEAPFTVPPSNPP